MPLVQANLCKIRDKSALIFPKNIVTSKSEAESVLSNVLKISKNFVLKFIFVNSVYSHTTQSLQNKNKRK